MEKIVIFPAAKQMVRSVIGNDAAKKLNQISLSNNTAQCRIEEMSLDISEQVVSEIRESPVGFAIQLYEFTNVVNCTQLVVFVQYVRKEGLKDELLFNAALKTTTKANDVFHAMYSFFKKCGLKWTDLKSCTTDGVPAMLRWKSGFQSHVKEVAPHAVCMHCIIHRFALSCKVFPKAMGSVPSLVVNMINNVKSSALSTQLFKLLCEDL